MIRRQKLAEGIVANARSNVRFMVKDENISQGGALWFSKEHYQLLQICLLADHGETSLGFHVNIFIRMKKEFIYSMK